MKIKKIASHVLRYKMAELLRYLQQYYDMRTTHLVEVETDQGISGWGECLGLGNVAIANKAILEQVIQPIILGANPPNRDILGHKVYNLLRDHGQKYAPFAKRRVPVGTDAGV